MSREAELTERKNDELRDILEEYDLPTSGNKEELVERILNFELGVTPQDDEAASQPDDSDEGQPDENDETAADDAGSVDTPPEDEPEEARAAEEPAEGEGDEVVVKFTGVSGLHETMGHRFSKNSPFAVMSKDDANALTQKRGRLFRLASPTEVEQFYS